MEKAMTIVYEVGNNLYVNITNKCPCSCTFCIRNNGAGAYGSNSLWLEHEPSEEEIISALKNADFKKYNEIVYCGYGEPTERIEVLAATARFIKENGGPPIRINTNGLSDLIHKKPTAFMLKGIADTVSISLNAGTKEEYLKVTRPSFGEESYEAMQKFAFECKKYVPNVVLSVVDVIGEEQIEAARKVADKLGIKLRIREYES
ncbi:MAG: TIGR04100 family radical SAM protein [Clostridium sp.]|nr:TIGR04100 family radical SAM protein [Clostridium sp.]MCM1548306.1 TIGR04100 family radical SAM protein [Ruminococcus sp.]